MSKSKFIVIDGDANDWEEAIRLCGNALVKKGYADQEFVDGCVNREREYPTGLPCKIPVAIPHFKSDGIRENSVCVLRLEKPIVFYRMDSSDEYIETRLIFNLAIKGANNHLEYLQKLISFVMNEERMRVCEQMSKKEMIGFLEEHLA